MKPFRKPSEQEREHVRRELEGAVENLPPRQRQAIRLLKLKEMSLKEAAVASGMSIHLSRSNNTRPQNFVKRWSIGASRDQDA